MVKFFIKKMGIKGAVSIHTVGPLKIKELNRKFRGQNRVTDVLAFAAQEGLKFPGKIGQELGDIFLCLPQIKKQARENGITFKNELGRILVHGLLHLVGYDHQSTKQAKKMFSKQEVLVKAFFL